MALDGPAVERACDLCRERRVKCDKRHPSCLRCEKLGKPCPGYDKKRKFVDEGIILRKKYQSATPEDAQFRSQLSTYSPAVTAIHSSPQLLPDPAVLGQRISSIPGDDGFLESNTENLAPQPHGSAALSRIADGESRFADANRALDDLFNDPSIDPAWFDIDPADYYDAGSGNSCGFLADFPNIVSELDRDTILPTTETVAGLGSEADLESIIPSDTPWEAQLHTSAIIVDASEHETAYLTRHFIETIGPWMDLFDKDEHFGSMVPLKALQDALLRNAIAAVSAKQLGRVKSLKPYLGNQCQKPAMMEVLDEADWYYKAANYYDKAIAVSRMYLQALSDSVDDPSTLDSRSSSGLAKADDLLVAVSIFSLYEWLDNLHLDWLQHLSGLKTLLHTLPDVQEPTTQITTITAGRKASFWNFTRADYHASYINHQDSFLDTESHPLWTSVGLQIQPNGSLYNDATKVKENRYPCRQVSELVAHTLLWIVLRVMNYLASDHNPNLAFRHERWLELTKQLDEWHDCLPQTFQPCAQIRYPMKTSRLPTATAIGLSAPSSSPSSGLTEVFFSMNVCAAALQLYHFARILLLRNPADSRPVDAAKTIKHAHQIIGIALGRPHHAVRVEMLLPLYVAGVCLEVPEERAVILELLRAMEKDTGCSTESQCLELMKEWGWNWQKMDVM